MNRKKIKPPRIAARILEFIIQKDIQYGAMGDFEEQFYLKEQENGLFKAHLYYWKQIGGALPYFIKNSFLWSLIMLNNYFKIAIRNLFRQKGYFMVNTAGLAIGMACCFLLVMFVKNELNYDNYNEKADRIYRLAYNFQFGGRNLDLVVCPPAAAETFVKEYPEILDAVRFTRHRGSYIIKYKEKIFKERGMAYCDASLFDIFTIPLLQGDPKSALKDPYTIVLSKMAAEKYFGKVNPLGKILKIDNDQNYKVTGIYNKIPNNSHFHFDLLASLNSLKNDVDLTNWSNENYNTYLLLNKNADPRTLEAKFPEIIKKYFAPFIERVMGKPLEELTANGNIAVAYYLQPLRYIHLHSDLMGELGINSDSKYVYIFSAIAIFILLIASINFMNLSTARSACRAREVGIRKVMGSSRRQLISQFLTESILLSFISMLTALILVNLALPFFNNLSGKELNPADSSNFTMILAILSITLITGFLSGCYPALYISAFKPVSVLKGQHKSGSGSKTLRSTLVVFQFTVSIILLINTLVIKNQLEYIQNKKLGFDKDQVLILEDTYLLGSQVEAFKNELLKNQKISSATISEYLPVQSRRHGDAVLPEGDASNKNTTAVQKWTVDYDYIKTMGMKIIKGRNFSKEYSTDTSSVIINQKLADLFGWEDPVNKRIGSFANDNGDIRMSEVIGVVEDFHFESLKTYISPLVIHLGESKGRISLRISGVDVPGTLDTVKKSWNKFLPGFPLEYTFMDDRFDTFYRGERNISQLLGIFSALGIFIGCLGLFGLAAFVSEQRTKEIGIRKVMGASESGIVFLLSKQFIKWVLIANLFAWPAAYFVVNEWLKSFAYRINIGIWVFVLSGMMAAGIALVTVSYQALKAARANPGDSLRYE